MSLGSNKIRGLGNILLYDTIRNCNHRYCSNVGISEDNNTNNAAERLKQSLWYILTVIMCDNIPYFTLILMDEPDWLLKRRVTSVIKHAAESFFIHRSSVFCFFFSMKSGVTHTVRLNMLKNQ